MRIFIALTLPLAVAADICAQTDCATVYGGGDPDPPAGKCLSGDQWDALKQRVETGLAEREMKFVNLEMNNWLSQNVLLRAAQILISEVMDFNVTINYLPGTSKLQNWVCCEAPDGSVGNLQFELWGSERKSVVIAGNTTGLAITNVGYEGASGLFIDGDFLGDKGYPLADTWSAFRYLPEYLEALPDFRSLPCEKRLKDETKGCQDPTNYQCQDKPWPESECSSDGYFITDACMENSTGCKEIIMANPTWDASWFEAMVNAKKLKMNLGYYGSNLKPMVRKLKQEGKLFMHYWWTPDPFIVEMNGVNVNFPRTTLDCMQNFNDEPRKSSVDCAFPLDNLKKVTNKEFLTKSSDIKAFFEQFRVSAGHIDDMMGKHTDGGGAATTAYEAACQWVKENPNVWEGWISNKERAKAETTTIVEGGGGVEPWVWGVVGGIGFLILVALALMLIKRHRDAANIRFLLDNNRIAEESCEAIAEMRLEEMEYLKEIERPNRIQKSFVRIIDTLMEYRRYLPAHLRAEAEEDGEGDASTDGAGSVASSAGDAMQKKVRRVDRSRSAASGASKASTVAQVAARQTAKFSMGLSMKKSTVMVLQLDTSADVKGDQINNSLQKLETVTAKTRTFFQMGLLGQTCLSWNTSIPCAGHHDLAINLVDSIISAFAPKGWFTPACGIYAGISMGSVHAGNCGTTAARHYIVNGQSMKRAWTLSNYARTLNAPALSDSGFAKGKAQLVSVIIDHVQFGAGAKVGGEFVYAPLSVVKAAEDEWMYQLEQMEKKAADQPHAIVNGVWNGIVSGQKNVKEALPPAKLFLNTLPYGAALIKILEEAVLGSETTVVLSVDAVRGALAPIVTTL
eukprot:Hpha_TRINITY_DN16613_c3_g4::TRINITY_DN16613_c3_g4_i1::g.181289::m.181289